MNDSLSGLSELISVFGPRKDALGTWTHHREKHSNTIDIGQINKRINKLIHIMVTPIQSQ